MTTHKLQNRGMVSTLKKIKFHCPFPFFTDLTIAPPMSQDNLHKSEADGGRLNDEDLMNLDPSIVVRPDDHWVHEFDQQTSHEYKDLHSADWWEQYFEKDTGFGTFMEDAYAADGKYAIRINPVTGKKEMMIAGTDSYGNWIQNVAEGLKGTATEKASLHHRENASEYYDEIAENAGVEVIYGHSRGAAHLTDMKYEATYVGIDGATSIGHKRPDMVNVIGDQAFDKIIGFGHKDTVKLKKRGFHNVTKSKTRIKAETKAKHQKTAGKVYARSKTKFEASDAYKKKHKRAIKKKKTSKFSKKGARNERRTTRTKKKSSKKYIKKRKGFKNR